MQRIEDQDQDSRELAKQSISWITYAARSLTATELQHALAIKSKEAFDEGDLVELDDILSVCAGLVTIDKQSNNIRFVHYTTEEFFRTIRQDWLPRGNVRIAITCISYLSYDVFASYMRQDEMSKQKWLERHQFLSFASGHWAQHALEAENESWRRPALAFLSDALKVSHSWNAMNNTENKTSAAEHIYGLHLATFYGLYDCVVDLLDEGYDPSPFDSDLITPMTYAARNGYVKILKLLLDRPRTKRHQGYFWQPPSPDRASSLDQQSAGEMRTGHAALLQDAEVDRRLYELGRYKSCSGFVELLFYMRQYERRVVLDGAIVNEQKGALRALLESGAFCWDDFNPSAGSPLVRAIEGGNIGMVEMLLGYNKVDLNHVSGNTLPLHSAIHQGDSAIVRLLLRQAGIDVEKSVGQFGSPLATAAALGNEGVVKMLLESGADPNAAVQAEGTNSSALAAAAAAGHEEVVKMLLKNGANPNAPNDITQGLPMQMAARGHHFGVAKILLEYGATANPRDAWQILLWRKMSRVAAAQTESSEPLIKNLFEAKNPSMRREHEGLAGDTHSSDGTNWKYSRYVPQVGWICTQCEYYSEFFSKQSEA